MNAHQRRIDRRSRVLLSRQVRFLFAPTYVAARTAGTLTAWRARYGAVEHLVAAYLARQARRVGP